MPSWRASDGRGQSARLRHASRPERQRQRRLPRCPASSASCCSRALLAAFVLRRPAHRAAAARPRGRRRLGVGQPELDHPLPVRRRPGPGGPRRRRSRQPAGTDATEKTFVVNPGDDIYDLAPRLHEAGFVASERAFLYVALQSDLNAELTSGNFVLRGNMTPAEVAEALVKARVLVTTLDITFREGLRIEQMTALLADPRVGHRPAGVLRPREAPDGGAARRLPVARRAPAQGRQPGGLPVPGHVPGGHRDQRRRHAGHRRRGAHPAPARPVPREGRRGTDERAGGAQDDLLPDRHARLDRRARGRRGRRARPDRRRLPEPARRPGRPRQDPERRPDRDLRDGHDGAREAAVRGVEDVLLLEGAGRPAGGRQGRRRPEGLPDLPARRPHPRADLDTEPGRRSTPRSTPDKKDGYFYFVAIPDTKTHAFAKTLAEHNANLHKYGYL